MSCQNSSPVIDRAPGEVPIKAWHDQALIGLFTFFNWPPNAAKVPQDLTGQTATLEVIDATGAVLATYTSAAADIAMGGMAGTISLQVPAVKINALTPGDYTYRLNTQGGPEPRRRLVGSFEVLP